MRLAVIALAGFGVWFPAAWAQEDPYRITEAEKAACTADAVRLCSDAYPDEQRLLACMNANRGSLHPDCAAVFSAGKRDRGLR